MIPFFDVLRRRLVSYNSKTKKRETHIRRRFPKCNDGQSYRHGCTKKVKMGLGHIFLSVI